MFRSLWSPFQNKVIALFHTLQQQIKTWVKPIPPTVIVGALTDLTRPKTGLIFENALLRHQLVVLQRHVKRPRFTWKVRIFMVITASRLPSWRQALLIVQPDTVLRWHRDLFKHVWLYGGKTSSEGRFRQHRDSSHVGFLQERHGNGCCRAAAWRTD